MTNEEVIIEMAKQAGMVYREFEDEFANANTDGVDLKTIVAFAKLIAGKEREEFAVHAVDIARRAIAEEREACAKVCNELDSNSYPYVVVFPNKCADAIRARGEAWVGLTEQEQGAIMESLNAYGTNLYHFANAIEAKLKEKNT